MHFQQSHQSHYPLLDRLSSPWTSIQNLYNVMMLALDKTKMVLPRPSHAEGSSMFL